MSEQPTPYPHEGLPEEAPSLPQRLLAKLEEAPKRVDFRDKDAVTEAHNFFVTVLSRYPSMKYISRAATNISELEEVAITTEFDDVRKASELAKAEIIDRTTELYGDQAFDVYHDVAERERFLKGKLNQFK